MYINYSPLIWTMAIGIFKQEALDQSAADYSRLSIASEQRAIIEGITKIVVNFLDIPPVAMNGFSWKILKQWQIENQKTAKELAEMPAKERIEIVTMLFEKQRIILKQVLKNKNDSHVVDKAFNATLKYYIDTFGNR